MEAGGARIGPTGAHSRSRWRVLKGLIAVFGLGLHTVGLYHRGLGNALDIRLTQLELGFRDLPAAFDGLRILHLTDIHVDALPATTDIACELVADVAADVAVLTGDYRFRVRGPHRQILPGMQKLVAALQVRHGVYGVLGNHDNAGMVPDFEALGITMLVNQSVSIERGGDALHLTGTDDVHYYYTDAAQHALAAAPQGFKIALIHSAELASEAAQHGYALYLSGHTHGGQISLPGGRPILTHLSRHRRYARGVWRHGSLQGYTSTGVGVSALPVRFNTRGEVALITLRRVLP